MTLLLLTAGSAKGQQCTSGTGNDATIIIPANVDTGLQAGDIIIARHDTLCVGQTVYQEGQSNFITIWGDDDLTAEIDGIPPNTSIQYSAYRPSTDVNQDEVIVTYASGGGTYVPDDIIFIDGFTLNGPLPVELVSFEGVADGPDVRLTWTTASETNNAGFEIEHLAQDTTFRRLAFVEGYGTTLEPQRYRHRVEGLEPGRHVFRLKQIDFDGTFEYSSEVEVHLDVLERIYLSEVYPNPFNPQATLTLTLRQPQEITVRVYNAVGRLVQTLYRGQVKANEVKVIPFDAEGLPSGLYFIRVLSPSFVMTRKALLTK